jgi:acyl dehydratase
MPVTINGVEGLREKSNSALGATEWEDMTFDRIQAFADATGDQQWIHVDRERIARESPFGAPIAHGYLTLSLVAGRFFDLLDLQGMGMVINYGTNKVRFPNPLKEGARFRLALHLGEVVDKKGGWVEAIFQMIIEIEGEQKPACAAECVFRFLPEQP